MNVVYLDKLLNEHLMAIEILNKKYDIDVVEIKLINQQLKILPENIGNLVALQKLNLGYNKLTKLPESLGNLTTLCKLYLEDNQLISLPDGKKVL